MNYGIMETRHEEEMKRKTKKLEQFYWRTMLHRLYDKVQPYRNDVNQMRCHKDKIAEIEKWLAIYITDLKRIKANEEHL